MNDIERRTLIGAAGIGAIAALSKAGPLNPPAGAVASTAKPLSDVEPRIAINATNTPFGSDNATLFRITAPGSYYLTGNVTGESGKNGISIAPTTSGGVTIDLNGFELIGVPGSQSGIVVTRTGLAGIRVMNGTVRDWGQRGVALNTASECVVENLVVRRSGFEGIHMGANSRVSNCSVSTNGFSNGFDGILVGFGGIIRGCVSVDNAGRGFQGVQRVLIEGCSALSNSGGGIKVSDLCEIRNNLVHAGAAAIEVGTGCLVRGNFCRDSAVGVQAIGADNVIVANHFAGHTNVYNIAAGNHYGPFIISNSNAAVIVGTAGQPSNMGTTDPNANFIN